jgi:hypothetical protein
MPPDRVIEPVDVSGDGVFGLLAGLPSDRPDQFRLDGLEELTDMLSAARITTETWHAFLDDFVDDEDLVARIKAQPPR